MKKFSKMLFTFLIVSLFLSNFIYVQEIRDNKSFKITVEEPSITERFWGGRDKTAVKNYSRQSDVPASINYT